MSLRSGQIDVIDSISPDSADQLSGLPGVAIDRVDGVRLNQLFYNFRKPPGHPLADARVRRALTYAIDGKSLIDEVMQGSATASKGVIPVTLDGAIETGEYIYDPARARKELDALGVRDLNLKIIWETGEFVADTDIMEAVVQMLSAVGVRPKLQQFEPGGDISTWRQGKAGDWDVLGNGYPGPTGLGHHHHAGNVRRHRRKGGHPRHLPRLHLPADHRHDHARVGGPRPRPPGSPAGRCTANDLGHLPNDVVVRPQGRPRPPKQDRQCGSAPHQLL